jgi:5'-nucleotidase
VSGISYTWDASDAAGTGNAIFGNVLVDTNGDGTPDAPLDDVTTYRVVANNFLSDGGDNFPTFKAGTNKLIGGLDIDSLVKYLQAHDPYTITATDRISSQP